MSDIQRVMVTAGAAGIGASIAAKFLKDGALVSIADIDGDGVEKAAAVTPGLYGVTCDVSDPVAVDGWFDDCIGRWGGVDVLVNSAGVPGPVAVVEDITPEAWRACLSVVLDSHFYTTRRAVPRMKAQGAGVIINLSSTAGLYGEGLRTPYVAGKWALVGFTKALAIELGPHGVRVNAVCPGAVRGQRVQNVIAKEAAVRGLDPDSVTAEYLAGQSISRFVNPEEVADLCFFLASPAASMITGQAIAVDGHTETFHIGR